MSIATTQKHSEVVEVITIPLKLAIPDLNNQKEVSINTITSSLAERSCSTIITFLKGLLDNKVDSSVLV